MLEGFKVLLENDTKPMQTTNAKVVGSVYGNPSDRGGHQTHY